MSSIFVFFCVFGISIFPYIVYLPPTRIELVTFSLRKKRSTPELRGLLAEEVRGDVSVSVAAWRFVSSRDEVATETKTEAAT